jgi:hypothetical protein
MVDLQLDLQTLLYEPQHRLLLQYFEDVNFLKLLINEFIIELKNDLYGMDELQ